MERGSWGRNSIFCCRKCIGKRTPCFRRRRGWKAKRWRLRGCRWKSRRRLRNCVSRSRTSNERGDEHGAANPDCVRTVGVGKKHAGAEDLGNTGNDAVGVGNDKAASGDRGKWKML